MSRTQSTEEPAPSFERQWLTLVGAPASELAPMIAYARARARRFPSPMNWLHPILIWLIDFFAPFLFTFRLRRARSLDTDALDRLMRKLKGHRLAIVRATALFATHPLMEAFTLEKEPSEEPHPLDHSIEHRVDDRSEFDLVVIGTGAGGAPVASQIAKQGLKVAILDKGKIVRPTSTARCIEKYYASQGMVGAIGGGAMLIPAGTSVGGTTSINSGTCLRPLPSQLQKWDEVWGTRFGDGSLDRYLDIVAEKIGITVPPRSLLSKSAAIVERGLEQLGRDKAYILPRNAPKCTGAGRCCFGCPTGSKRSTDHTFLPEAVAAGATLLHDTTATRIIEDDDRVEVEIDTPEGKRRIRCRHLVISAGALFTPGLLRRNRLGAHWRKAGKHLKVHPATKLFGYFPGLAHGERGIPQDIGYRPPELPGITMEGIHTPKSAVGPLITTTGERWRWWMEQIDDTASFGFMSRDRGNGRVFEIAGNPVAHYRLHPENVREIIAGAKLLGEIFFAAGAERVLMPLGGMQNEFVNAGELAVMESGKLTSQNLQLSGFHPQGTAGIGRVVDTNLRLSGCKRLSVCDASVLPDSPGVNPMVSIMALSLRLADHLLETLAES